MHVNEISSVVCFCFSYSDDRNDSNIEFRFYRALLNFPRCIIALRCGATAYVSSTMVLSRSSYSEINYYRHLAI